jgi:squalene/oxidosqualene cyclase-like protein
MTPLERAARALVSHQHANGHWEGEMVWCPVVTAQVAIARHCVGLPFEGAEAARVLAHFRWAQLPNGAFGLHPEHPGSLFVTALVYVAARLLGAHAYDTLTMRAREWLREQPDGMAALPTWGKFWLSLLGLYDRHGVRPVLPELLQLPRFVPLHPFRLYCHTRYIYLAMGMLFARRTRFDLSALAEELYPNGRPLASRFRYHVAATDLHHAVPLVVCPAEWLMSGYDAMHHAGARRRALARCEDLIARELEATDHLTLSPVNGTLVALALHESEDRWHTVLRVVEGFEYYRFDDAERGLRYSGGRTRTWDTAFALEALLATPLGARDFGEAIRAGYRFLADQQMRVSVAARDPLFPDTATGGWCLGDARQAWPVSDCTAEALAAILSAHAADAIPLGERISDARLAEAARFVLSRQNADGGFGSYECARASKWLELLNPAEMFTNCMTDRSYVECTGSCLVALSRFRAAFPNTDSGPVARAIARGRGFLLKQQFESGEFHAAWGIFCTYGAFHAVRGLRAAGVPVSAEPLQRAARWLIAHQRADGGWGEDWRGCLEQRYIAGRESQPVQTAWAVLALCEVVGAGHVSVRRGAEWLAAHAGEHGGANGVFFGTAMLDYRLYPVYFPLWALGATATAEPGG